jgi:hypothetical protein
MPDAAPEVYDAVDAALWKALTGTLPEALKQKYHLDDAADFDTIKNVILNSKRH